MSNRGADCEIASARAQPPDRGNVEWHDRVMSSATGRVIGIDACKKGWVGVTNDERGYFGITVEELVRGADLDGHLDVIAIDIPIGLPLAGARQADELARRLVGRRASSVFSTPVRAALAAMSHAEATALNAEHSGNGISQQAYALRTKILEVDAWVRRSRRVAIEVHPEVCFAIMAGRPLEHPKSTWAGGEERRRLLSAAGVTVPQDLGLAGAMAGVDDVLDAAAASWAAERFLQGAAAAHPAIPQDFGDGHAAAIWA